MIAETRMKKIDRIVTIELDGKVLKRLYTGSTYVDAEISVDALALDISDSARVLHSVHQRWASAQTAKAS